MKKCQTCGQDNTDTMRFCVECGSTLPDAPIIVNFGGSGAGQPNPFGNATQQSNPFGDATQQQQAGGKGNFGNFPNQFSNVPPPRKSNKKTFLIIGGIIALFLLVFAAGAAVIGYNMLIKNEVAVSPTPTPASPTPTASTKSSSSPKSPTPTASASPEDSPTTNSSSGASADVDRVWVDYNVTQKGKKGMRIHVKFTVHKMKGVDSFLAIYFEKADGEKLLTNNKEYRSKDGQVATFQSLAPAYPDTVYEDEQLFIPYTEFSLDSGTYNLKMDIDVIYENGDLVQHLKYQEFEYTEP